MSILADLSNNLSSNVEAIGPSIVRVEARRRLSATGVVWSADGVIVTTNHVVTRDEDIRIGLHNGDVLSASVIGRDPSTDLAVLRVDGQLTVPQWADVDEVKVGHLVLALGRPGKTVQATLGVISALSNGSASHPSEGGQGGHGHEHGRGGHGPGGGGGPRFSGGQGRFGGGRRFGGWRNPAGGRFSHYLQTDVVMYPGFSGGPLVDAVGAVIGLNTSGMMRGISLTIPNPTIQSVVSDLLEHGRIRRGYLGVAMQPVRLPEALAKELEQETGLLIVSVEPGTPAEKTGLVLGDTIVTFDGESVRHMDHLLNMLTGDSVGSEVDIQIVRGGSLQTLQITVGEHD